MRLGKERGGRRLFDDLPGIHQGHPVGHVGHHAQVVGDQQQAQLALLLQGLEQVQHLLLDGHVQRGGWLIGNQVTGLGRQGHGNHHPLLLAATHLEGVAVDATLRLGDAHTAQPVHGLAPRRHPTQAGVRLDGLDDLVAHPHHRVEAGGGLLKDDADVPATDAAHLRFRQVEQLGGLAVGHVGAQVHTPLLDAAVVGQEAHQRQGGHALAATGLPDQCEGFAALQRQAQAIERAHQARFGVQRDMKVMGLQHRNLRLGERPHGGERDRRGRADRRRRARHRQTGWPTARWPP